MGKNNKLIISKISVFCVGLLFATFSFFYLNNSKNVTKSNFLTSKNSIAKQKFMQNIQDVWSGTAGFICPKETNKKGISDEFYNCNTENLECYLTQTNIFKIEENEFKLIKPSEKFLELDRRNNPIINFEFKGQKLKIKLFNTCSDVYLPQRKYSAGPKGFSFIWDNINQNIFIDKNYVSNLDTFLWNKRKDGELYKPNTKLTLNEKINYCQFRGKQLLQSRFFDAASFYVGSQPINPVHIYKFPYPWTKKRRTKTDELKSRDCANIYSKECESIRPYEFFGSIATTWIGINYSLGSYPEIFINKLIPRANLKVSSFFVNSDSPWHKVGMRGHYDGLKPVLIDQYKESKVSDESIDSMEAGFRCMLNL